MPEVINHEHPLIRRARMIEPADRDAAFAELDTAYLAMLPAGRTLTAERVAVISAYVHAGAVLEERILALAAKPKEGPRLFPLPPLPGGRPAGHYGPLATPPPRRPQPEPAPEKPAPKQQAPEIPEIACREAALQYCDDQQCDRDRGYVYFFQGNAFQWSDGERPASYFEPGVIAIALMPGLRPQVATGGDADSGAAAWKPLAAAHHVTATLAA